MPKKIDLTGQIFGRLTVIEPAQNKNNKTYWLCKCECGNTKIVSTSSLRSNRCQSCGCLHKEITAKTNKERIIDLTGQTFGKLTVIKQVESYRGHSAWLCQCECGNTKIVNSVELKNGDTLSCGCLRNSMGEEIIEKILIDNNISYLKEYSFSDLLSDKNKPLKFDFAIFTDNTHSKLQYLIEYDGEQHYLKKADKIFSDTLDGRQYKDNLKNKYCLNNNILLYRIP